MSATAVSLELKKRLDRLLGLPLVAGIGAWRAWRRSRGALARSTPPTPGSNVRHVVLAKLWGIGNLAMLVPHLAAVRRCHPGARITFLTLARNRPLLEAEPDVDRVLTIRDRGVRGPIADLWRTIRALREDRVDLFLDFEQFLRVTGLVARAAGVRFSVGFDTPGQHRAALHDRTVACVGDRHMAVGFGDVVRAAGIATDGVASHELHVGPAAAARAAKLVTPQFPRPWIVLHPGSGDNFPGRRWPVARFAAAGAELVRRFGGTLILNGAGAERPLIDELARRLERERAPMLDLCGRLDLPLLVAVLARADLLLSNDTGPVHLAAAVGTPVVGLYGPNSPKLYGPLGALHRALYRPLPCSPCLTNQNGKSSSCKLPLCILSIPLREVVDAASETLQRSRKTAEVCA